MVPKYNLGHCSEDSQKGHEGSCHKTARLLGEVVCPHIAAQRRPSYVEVIRGGMAARGYRGHFRAAKAVGKGHGRENGRPVLLGDSMARCGGVIHGWIHQAALLPQCAINLSIITCGD